METIKLSLKQSKQHPNPYHGVELPNKPITDEKAFTDYFNLITQKDYPKSNKYYCVMLFFELSDITCDPNDHSTWINTRNTYFHNGTMALQYYANTPCPASQLIDAESIKELIMKRNQMLLNFKDKKFLDELHESI